MSVTEVLVIVSGLAIGYWLVAVFLPHARPPRTTIDIGAPAWHEVLGVPPDAGREAIHDAYRQRLAEYHPDKVATMAPEIRALAERRATELAVAYDRALMHLHDSGR